MNIEATCPQCNGGDNKPYVTESGIAMRACFRCMIQWRDQPAADFASEAVKAERKRIAEELEADADGTCGTDDLFKKVRRHIDRLRGERE